MVKCSLNMLCTSSGAMKLAVRDLSIVGVSTNRRGA
jgi:hypothetical protein